MGLLPRGSLASIVLSAMEILTARLTSTMSLALANQSQVCVELGEDKWSLLGLLAAGCNTHEVPREAGLSLLCWHLHLSGVPVSVTLCEFVGTAWQQLPIIIFSLQLSPLCSSLTALLPNLSICSVDKESLSQLWFCFSVSRQ